MYEAPEGTEEDAKLHRMHAEISFMWSVIREGRMGGKRCSKQNGEKASDKTNKSYDGRGDCTAQTARNPSEALLAKLAQ